MVIKHHRLFFGGVDMTYHEFHEWLLFTYGEDNEFNVDDLQKLLGFERKMLLNLLSRLKEKRLLTRMPQYDKKKKAHNKKSFYIVHEEEKEDLTALADEEHEEWMRRVRESQRQRELRMAIGFRV
jgi:hypothetical protein